METYDEYMKRLVNQFRGWLMLNEWHIDLVLDHEFDSGIEADANVNEDYLGAKIRISKEMRKSFDEGRYWYVARVVLHELCHILTEPLYNIAVDAITNPGVKFLDTKREQATERIARIVLALMPPAEYQPLDTPSADTTIGVTAAGS